MNEIIKNKGEKMMRKNNFYAPVIPTSRNEFVDYVQDSKEVIAVNHELLKSMDVELAENRTKGSVGTVLKTAGVAGLLFCNILNPLTWILSLGSILVGGQLKNEIKNYNAYAGLDTEDNYILLLVHKKKVDKKHDKIILSSFIKEVYELENPASY